MPVNNTSSLAGPFVPNGSTTIFPFAFNAQLPGDVSVFDGDGALVSPALYTVALYEGDGGTVTFSAAPTLAQYDELFIALTPSFAQTADFTNAGPSYNPAQLTAALDAISSRIISLKGDVDRSLKVGRGDSLTAIPSERAGKFLAFDASGNPVTADGTGADGSLRADVAASTGAALIGSVAQGPGAVTRDVQAKLRDTVSVKDFGAVGDNATDDSTAFANAIAAGREVYIPAGTYRITPRTFSNLLSLKIRGAGRDVTKLILTSTGTALTFSDCQWLQLSDFSIETLGGAQVLANANGIELNTGSSNCIIERVNVYGFSLDGLRLIGTSGSPLSGNTVKDVYILGCGRHQAREFWNNDATWDNCQFGRLAGVTRAQIGWFSENCGENGAVNVKLWENTVGFRGLNNLGMRYVGCRFEESQEKNCDLEGCDDNQFSGCRMYSGSKAGDGLHDYFYATNCDRLQIVGCNINTWDASFGRWAVNIDSGCNDLTFKSNVLGGFSSSFGPIRIAGGVTVDGDLVLPFTASGVAAGATVYPSRGAVTAEAAAFNSLPRRFAAVSLYAGTIAAPGAGESFTYTLRKNAVDTAMASASSGASSFSANAPTSTPQILFASGDFSSVKLVASGAATVTDHRGYLVLVAY